MTLSSSGAGFGVVFGRGIIAALQTLGEDRVLVGDRASASTQQRRGKVRQTQFFLRMSHRHRASQQQKRNASCQRNLPLYRKEFSLLPGRC